MMATPMPDASDLAATDEESIIWLMITAAYLHDETTIRDLLATIPPDQREQLARAVSDRLADMARNSGIWKVWAWALHHLTPEWHAEAGRELWSRLARWAAPQPAVRTDGRRQLASLAARLARARVPGKRMLEQLNLANAGLDPPVSSSDVGAIFEWAVKQAVGARYAGAR